MRAVVLGLAGLFVAGNASAADYLRGSTFDGPQLGYNWAGIYVGAQAGMADASFDFGKAAQPLVANMVRDLLIEKEASISTLSTLPSKDASSAAYGGFVGYNSQWGQVVLGAELNYNHLSLSAAASDNVGRSFVTSDNYTNQVQLITSASGHVTDYAELRGRVGYASGWIMPYMAAGVVAGRIDYTRDASVFILSQDLSGAVPPKPTLQLIDSRHDAKNGVIDFGYSVGLGADIGLLPGVFVRAEWEYVQFNQLGGFPIQLQNYRLAAAVKF
jgi:opacity protein-like surface antigen